MNDPQTGPVSFDVAARHAQVIGEGPRVAPVPNVEVDASSWALVNDIRRSAGAPPTDDLPPFTRILAKHGALFGPSMELGNAIYQGRIPPRERELAILRCGWLCGAPFEWGEHVMIGQRCGLTAEEIERATHGSSASGWNEQDAAILRGVEELIADSVISDATWATLARYWDEVQMIEYPLMVGQYVALAYLQNSLRVPLADYNAGLAAR